MTDSDARMLRLFQALLAAGQINLGNEDWMRLLTDALTMSGWRKILGERVFPEGESWEQGRFNRDHRRRLAAALRSDRTLAAGLHVRDLNYLNTHQFFTDFVGAVEAGVLRPLQPVVGSQTEPTAA